MKRVSEHLRRIENAIDEMLAPKFSPLGTLLAAGGLALAVAVVYILYGP